MKSIIFLMIFFVAGCQSEIDKCVNSTMAAWDVKQARVEKKWLEQEKIKKDWSEWKTDQIDLSVKKPSTNIFDQFDTVEKPDERSRIEVESIERKRCMRFAAGK